MNTLYTILLIVGGCVLVVVLIRIVSRRHATACPAWLIPLLENPYMNTLAGSQLLLERAHVTEGMVVLDIGCGPGRITLPAARRVGARGRVTALDIQPAMLSILKRRIDESGLTNIELILGGAGEGKIPRKTFDRALLVTVLGEIVDQKSALKEMFESLKPGGILSVTEVIPDPHYQSRKRLIHLASNAGFVVVETLGPWYAYTMNLRKPGEEVAT